MQSAIDYALPRVESEEGFRAVPYRDSVGKLTVGYGFCVDAGISRFAADALCRAQVAERQLALMSYAWYANLDPMRQSVCLDMAFNDGLSGLLHFPKMIAALTAKDYPTAAAELLDSAAARELPTRYGALAQILKNGQ